MNTRIAKAAAWLFAPPTPEREKKEERSRQRQEERLGSTPLFKKNNNTTTTDGDTPGAPVKKKRESKRTWSEPSAAESVHQTVIGDPAQFKRGQCCTLRCTERFSAAAVKETRAGAGRESYNADYLRREQEEFRQFGTEVDRKAFVIKHVPPATLSKGSMFAAGSPVCNFAFTKFFGVSKTLVASVKGTPKALASPSATRCVVGNYCSYR